ncbi:Uncharacterized protein OBRU01_14994, partial [Operophtera brumata]
MGKQNCVTYVPPRACRSRELRGGILYTDCFCLRRNGLQHDCRRSGCITSSPLCQVYPAPLCEPASVACVRHYANPHAEALSAICKMRRFRCSPCGPMVCYKYEDCGPALQCLPRSAFKRNGLQDCQYFQQGSIRYLCRQGPCPRPCPPPCPPCVRRPPPGKTYVTRFKGKVFGHLQSRGERRRKKGRKRKPAEEDEESRASRRDHVLQLSLHQTQRTPARLPSHGLARARGLADPTPLAAHLRAQAGGGAAGGSPDSGPGSGKKFIVCELKSIAPNVSANKGGSCCKCPTSQTVASQGRGGSCIGSHAFICPSGSAPKPSVALASASSSKCPCTSNPAQSDQNTVFVFDEKTINKILSSFDNKELAATDDMVIGAGGRARKVSKTVAKEEHCSRPGCVHWQPPPPCVWDAPCKADCFEAHPGIQPGRNPLTGGGGQSSSGGSKPAGGASGSQQPRNVMKLLTPECCTGCSAPGGGCGAAAGGGGPAAGLPVMVMKLC